MDDPRLQSHAIGVCDIWDFLVLVWKASSVPNTNMWSFYVLYTAIESSIIFVNTLSIVCFLKVHHEGLEGRYGLLIN